MADEKKYLSKIVKGSDTLYIKDLQAWSDIEEIRGQISGGMHYLGKSTTKIEDGDAVTVDGMLNRFENMVEIKGAVFRPAQYQLGGSITTVKSLIEAADGVTEDAFTAHAVMHRLKADRSLEIIPVDVQGILNGTVADIPLKNEDVLFIPTDADLRQERTLTITGYVMSPGTYQFADNTTIEDLIIEA